MAFLAAVPVRFQVLAPFPGLIEARGDNKRLAYDAAPFYEPCVDPLNT